MRTSTHACDIISASLWHRSRQVARSSIVWLLSCKVVELPEHTVSLKYLAAAMSQLLHAVCTVQCQRKDSWAVLLMCEPECLSETVSAIPAHQQCRHGHVMRPYVMQLHVMSPYVTLQSVTLPHVHNECAGVTF